MAKKKYKELVKVDRHKQIADYFRENPYSTLSEASKFLSIPDKTLKYDILELTKRLREESVHAYEIHRARILKDINGLKERCLKKLKMCRGATAGTRWVEEWTKLTKEEVRILGLYAPDKAMSVVAHVNGREDMTKEKRDAIVDAILIGDREGVIEIGVDAESRES